MIDDLLLLTKIIKEMNHEKIQLGPVYPPGVNPGA